MRFIVWTMILLLCVSAAKADKVDEQAKLQKIQKELTESKGKLKENRQQQQEVLGKLVVITQQLRQANQKISKAKTKIQTNETKIGQLADDLRHHEEDLQLKSEMLEKRIREIYKNSDVGYLELLFSSSSMSDFMTRFYFFEKVMERDSKLIMDLKGVLKETQVKKADLADKTKEIKVLTAIVIEQKQKIAEQAEEKKKVFNELQARESDYEKQITELEKSSNELEAMIRKKMAERGRAGPHAHGSGTMIWPLHGRITSPFGAYRRYGRSHRHTGVDIANTYGTPIVAADAGEVIFAGWWDGYGKAVVIDHGKGIATVYGHMSRLYMQAGMAVAKGQTIGLEGSTGNSTGPHCHFEVRRNGVPVNPMPYLP